MLNLIRSFASERNKILLTLDSGEKEVQGMKDRESLHGCRQGLYLAGLHATGYVWMHWQIGAVL